MKSPLVTRIKFYCLSIVLFISLPTDMGAASQCKTTDREKCVFPFKYGGRVYTECTWDWAFESDGNDRAWCGTREDARYDWGDCGEGCPIPGEETIPNIAVIIPLSD